jgi:hypothetical protein
MSRDDDTVDEKIEALVPLVIGVLEEKATSGPGLKFVWSGGGGVGIAGTTKDTEVFIGRGDAKEGE